MTLKNAINGFRIKDRLPSFIEQGISTQSIMYLELQKCSVMNLFKQLLNVCGYLNKIF
jgi:hypothetical protein